MNKWQGERALVAGAGIEGAALTKFLLARGARVTLADSRPLERLGSVVTELASAGALVRAGTLDPALLTGHDVLYTSQSLLVASEPLLVAARATGMPVHSALTLTHDLFAGRIAAVTGSSGKTTTTSLISAIFTAGNRPHLLAGNIGAWPLEDIAAAGPDTWMVMEVSHTQLQLARHSVGIACVTNVTPNHLDQFDWDGYVDLKRRHVCYQGAGDTAVLNRDNDLARSFAAACRGAVHWFSLTPFTDGDGAFERDGIVTLRRSGRDEAVLPVANIPLRGRHNVENVLAAAALSSAAGIDTAAIAAAVRDFKAVPHRLELVAVVDGAAYYNDSIATAPERTLAGMRSFRDDERLVLLLGGRDKHLPLNELAGECARRCRGVVTFGEAGPLFAGALEQSCAQAGVTIASSATLDEAAALARGIARPGDVVLLSPAGTSFDAYPNFERRGEHFRRLVQQWSGG